MEPVPTAQTMKKVADGDEVRDEPLDPEHQRVVDAMRYAREVEERADG